MVTKDEALKLALEALEASETNAPFGTDGVVYSKGVAFHQQAITAIKEALAQPAQEPVAWMYWQNCFNDDGTQTGPWVRQLSTTKPRDSVIYKDVTALYTAPPQRPLVGLTDDEIEKGREQAMRWAEAALKEKNV